jgi:reelin
VLAQGGLLSFSGAGLRRAQTRDLDTLGTSQISFYFNTGANGVSVTGCGLATADDRLLVMYSVNGGVSFILLEQITLGDSKDRNEFSLLLPDEARTSSTRFMFWVPGSHDAGSAVWVRSVLGLITSDHM